MPVPFPLAGEARVTALANIRQGQPSLRAAVIRKVQADATVHVAAVVAGDAVQGNALWFQLAEGGYIWTGACGPLQAAASPSDPAATAPRPPVTSRRDVPIVVDLYHGDRVTSFAQARAAGVRGVIHKATTGAHGRDNLYADRRRAAAEAGLLWGAYHWGTGQDAAAQVDNFLGWADPDENTLVAIDFETDSGSQMTLDRAREVLELIERRLGRKAVIYSGSTIKEALGTRTDPFFGAHRLWLAQYGPRAKVQRSWSTWWLWQYAETVASIPGIPGNHDGAVDLDTFAGSEDDLAREWAS